MLERIMFIVEERAAGSRLDRYLRVRLPGVPAKSIRFAIEAGEILVNGVAAVKGSSLCTGDQVSVRRIAEERDWLPEPGDLPGASVLHADESVAVLVKPPDVHTEPQRPMEPGTLAGFLLHRFPHVVRVSPGPGLTLLTRLDYATSGVVPAALDEPAFAFLTRERERGRIRKVYACVVAGRMRDAMILSGRIDTEGGSTVKVHMEFREPDPLRWTTVTPVLEGENATLVRAEIGRGKRHQIRAHLAAAGFPILGDRRYSAVPPDGPGRERLMLHATEVEFIHPRTGVPVRVVSPLPAEFGVT
jgi:23S rRNA pseudouridine1911/1915/1917 synthase